MEKQIQEILKSQKTKIALYVLAGVVLALCIFQAGVVVGYHKANYSYRFGEKYYSAFGPGHKGPGFGIPPNDVVGGHGASGKVIRVDAGTLVIEDSSNIEKVISVEPTTIIRRMRDTISMGDIVPNEMVVVFGTPDENGTIEANLIRVLPGTPAPLSATPEH